jgi:hypothetical protein
MGLFILLASSNVGFLPAPCVPNCVLIPSGRKNRSDIDA